MKLSLSAFVVCFILPVLVKGQLQKGDNCDNNQGKCIPLRDCPSAMAAFQSGKYPKTCGFEQNQPLVCCSGSESTISISQQKCRTYVTFAPEFEVFAIVGGTDTIPKEFPHMAALGYLNGNEILWQCGGSLVSEQFVLTAAHCLSSAQFGPVIRVRLGDINLSPGDNAASSSSQDYEISERIPHPSYKAPSVYNDIALLKLATTVGFNAFIKPACLYTTRNIPSNIKLIATGWGLTEFAGSKSDTLQKVDLELYTEQQCNEVYANDFGTRKIKDGILPDLQFCAGGKGSIKDACQGDSGGPLQTYVRNDKIYNIVGITSFGKACGIVNIPGVYTRVSFYISWLEKIIWP